MQIMAMLAQSGDGRVYNIAVVECEGDVVLNGVPDDLRSLV